MLTGLENILSIFDRLTGSFGREGGRVFMGARWAQLKYYMCVPKSSVGGLLFIVL